MKNKEITIYELMGLIKDNKAPKKIKIDRFMLIYDEEENWYYDERKGSLSGYLYARGNFLNTKIEILTEENDEWEDIEKYQYSIIPPYFDLQNVIKTINENFEKHQKALRSVIKNQKYLKERLENKNGN